MLYHSLHIFSPMNVNNLRDKILSGSAIDASEAIALASLHHEARMSLREVAAEVTARFHTRKFDSCSIINARSGRCSENCKWCAQSAHYHTGIREYALVDRDTCMHLARYNASRGIGRFSMVTSGRRLSGEEFRTACSYLHELHHTDGIDLCASMGLLNASQLAELRRAGVTRYHCNLETAPSFFPTLCTTHTIDQKVDTLRMAREAGMEVCSGGIIGMGETMEQRVELALKLREIRPVSIPLNILHPIPGTPLESMPPLTADEVLDTVAIFRMVHPRAVIRFAGGRDSLSPETQREAIRIGVNGAIMGDLLTTIGSRIEQDKIMVQQCGMEF